MPQGTVLGPILFLSYINDLPESVKSRVRLFADDCIIYRTISNENDCRDLQNDLDSLSKWEKEWCMSFNAAKCTAITITRKRKKIIFDYSLHNQTLERTEKATYLGVELSSNLTWAEHIKKTCAKANRSIAFLRRNLRINDENIKETAYKGLVRPIVEYCSPIWNPHHKKYISMLDMVQRRAARFVKYDYHRRSSVTSMLDDMKWESLECRRTRADIVMLYKIHHGMVAIPAPSVLVPHARFLPESPHRFQPIYASTDAYMYSFYPRTVRIWNELPSCIPAEASLLSLKAALSKVTF